MQLFKAVMNSQEDTLSNLLEEQQALNINAQWAVANNITPLEIALNKAIKAAKEYYEIVATTRTRQKISTGLMIGGGCVAAFAGALCSKVSNVLNDQYCSYTAVAGLLTAGFGYYMNASSRISSYASSMQRKLAIVQILLNNKDINLAATQLNVHDILVQQSLRDMKNILTQEELDYFAYAASTGQYDNLIFKAQ